MKIFSFLLSFLFLFFPLLEGSAFSPTLERKKCYNTQSAEERYACFQRIRDYEKTKDRIGRQDFNYVEEEKDCRYIRSRDKREKCEYRLSQKSRNTSRYADKERRYWWGPYRQRSARGTENSRGGFPF